ncbi:MAG: phenylalanine--tRNA ligase subunit beta [Granulosicoccus sp.]
MKFSEKWLREWVNPPVDTQELGDQLTFMGLEVDEIVSAAPDFKGVIVARIASVSQHPDADRLRICEVDDGTSELVQVVCGASNARSGLITALAQVGGKLPDGTKIKKAKLRGVESMGMLCSASELGLSDDKAGIMELTANAPPGTSLIEWLELDDAIVDIDLTPDRGDCLSIRGIARDLCAKNDLPMRLREINNIPAKIEDQWPVLVDDASACVRYSGRVIRDVALQDPAPSWMVERLRRAGVRSINPAVDITNYVMLELGQPMHAFDIDKLQGAIQVRLARTGERLTLLDGRDVALDDDTTIIADDSGPIGIAGIMGGQSTGVDESSKNIFFESALFLPELIAGKPRRYASHTDSAHRFERGVDPAGQAEALEYATGLLRTLAGGSAGPLIDWQHKERMPLRPVVTLRRSRLARILGVEPEPEVVDRVFARLGIESVSNEEGWTVTAPSYRYDLAIEEDYVEEVARVLGYESLPRTSPTHRPVLRAVPETRLTPLDVKRLLVSRGYQEIVTYSFVDAKQQSQLRPDLQGLALANPISSELGVMRTTLIVGLISSLQRNLSRQLNSMRLFETGLRFLPNAGLEPKEHLDEYIRADHGDDLQIDGTIEQQSTLAGLVAGRRSPENWESSDEKVDFFSVKADIEVLLAQANGTKMTFVATDLEMLHPGQRAGIVANGIPVGYVGALNPAIQQAMDIEVIPFVFEISLAALTRSQVPKAKPLSRFPQVRRDIALLIDKSVDYQSVLDVVRENAPAALQEVKLFDVYQGDKVAADKKSMALGLILQDFSRTLEDSDVEQAVNQVVAALGTAYGAVLRV